MPKTKTTNAYFLSSCSFLPCLTPQTNILHFSLHFFHLPFSRSSKASRSLSPPIPYTCLRKTILIGMDSRDSSDLTLLSTWPHAHSSAALSPPWHLPSFLVTSLAVPLIFLGSSRLCPTLNTCVLLFHLFHSEIRFI